MAVSFFFTTCTHTHTHTHISHTHITHTCGSCVRIPPQHALCISRLHTHSAPPASLSITPILNPSTTAAAGRLDTHLHLARLCVAATLGRCLLHATPPTQHASGSITRPRSHTSPREHAHHHHTLRGKAAAALLRDPSRASFVGAPSVPNIWLTQTPTTQRTIF